MYYSRQLVFDDPGESGEQHMVLIDAQIVPYEALSSARDKLDRCMHFLRTVANEGGTGAERLLLRMRLVGDLAITMHNIRHMNRYSPYLLSEYPLVDYTALLLEILDKHSKALTQPDLVHFLSARGRVADGTRNRPCALWCTLPADARESDARVRRAAQERSS